MFHFTCDTCDFRVDIEYVPRVYVLPDGRTLTMMQRHVWCPRCARVSVAEALTEDPDALAARLERREHHLESVHTGNYVSAFTKAMAQKIMPDLCRRWIRESDEMDQLIADWKRLRTAGQTCLRCGNTNMRVPEKSWADLPHVPCPGTLRCTGTIVGAVFVDRRLPHQYNVQGELVRRGRMSDDDDAEELYLWWPGT